MSGDGTQRSQRWPSNSREKSNTSIGATKRCVSRYFGGLPKFSRVSHVAPFLASISEETRRTIPQEGERESDGCSPSCSNAFG